MIISGVVLVVLGLLLPRLAVLITIGVALVVVGVLINCLPIGGRQHRVW